MFLYEEFMARSSTRMALKKGGNFMGMMNVLMQLRKVCNHPDLFEPRAVITPFAMDSIDYEVPVLVTDVSKSSRHGSSNKGNNTNDDNGNDNHSLKTVSEFLLYPLWCGSGGVILPSVSLDYDVSMAEQLLRLQQRDLSDYLADTKNEDDPGDVGVKDNMNGLSTGLAALLTRHKAARKERHSQRIAAQESTNTGRCSRLVFPFPSRLLRLVETTDTIGLSGEASKRTIEEDIMASPLHLLAAKKSVTERSKTVDEMVKKFVFCVPKAGVGQPRLNSSKPSRTMSVGTKSNRLDDMLVEPITEMLRPFQHAQARLSSFFPDKRLVQFDAGKLQTLSTLLHDLKRGGHRALIFTQMSKMLDVLEAFLNLNGHTYLRLDGATGVDRRQRLMDKFNNDEKIFCFILSTRSGGLGINLTGADTVIFYDSDWNPAM